MGALRQTGIESKAGIPVTSAPPRFPHSDPKNQTKDSDGLSHFPYFPLTEQFNSTKLFPHPPSLTSNMPKFGTVEANG